MKKPLLLLSALLFSLASFSQILDGGPFDSTTITFDISDSLHHKFDSTSPSTFVYVSIDTIHTHLWRIGKTRKLFFSAGGYDTTFAIMTDTSQPYPVSANDWFILKISPLPLNCIIDFTHKYQTISQRSGGIVEFSRDKGLTWDNVLGNCNIDGSGTGPGVYTSNFYSKTDTLLSGEPAFTGAVGTWKYSRLQLFSAIPARMTGGGPGCTWSADTMYVRFRFKSDTLPAPLDGWIIDSIKVESDAWGSGYVHPLNYQPLSISPNPSPTGVFIFPTLNDEKNTTLEITNAIGQRLFTAPYTHRLDLSAYPEGLYLYKAVNSTEYYSGRLLIQ